MLEFNVKTASLGPDAYVVAVEGEADLHSAPELERELRGVLDLGGRSVAIDLGAVGFIDSTVLGLLLRFHPRFRARGGELVLVSDDRRILRTLEITGLNRIFRVERRLGDALAALDSGDGVVAAPRSRQATLRSAT